MSFQKCAICIKDYKNCTSLDLHMKIMHAETQLEQQDRKQRIILKLEDESKARKEQIEQEKEDHKTDNEDVEEQEEDSRGTKRELETTEDENEAVNSEYTKVTDGAENEDDLDEVNAQGITFRGKSRKYIGAFNRLREKMIQGAEFRVKEFKLKIKSTPKQKPMQVEVTEDNGEKGRAQIQMYTPGKKGATVRITRASKEGFETVKVVADEFIETFLVIFLKGLIKGEEEIKKHILTLKEEKNDGNFRCDKCDKWCAGKQGLKVHLSWHIRNPNTQMNGDKISSNKKAVKVSFIEKTLQTSFCEYCDEKFTGDMKYQTINALLVHKKKCTNKPKLNANDKVNQNCVVCAYKGKK